MRQGSGRFQNGYPQLQERDVLYSGATGTNYGISNDKHNAELDCSGFAGYSGIDSNYYASGADFGVLPQNNRYFNLKNVDRDTFKQKIYKTVSGEIQPEIVILTEKEEKQLFEILSEESSIMAEMYNQLFSCACRIMRNHAPKSVASNIDRIVFQTLFFRTVGLIGGYTVKSGAIAVPDFEGPAAVYVRENTKAAENSVNQGVLV